MQSTVNKILSHFGRGEFIVIFFIENSYEYVIDMMNNIFPYRTWNGGSKLLRKRSALLICSTLDFDLSQTKLDGYRAEGN